MTVFEMNDRIEAALHPKLDKYAIYLRKSREDLKAEERGEGETLARHRKILTDFAARQGLYIEHVYEEIVSGDTIKDRPQIQKLISDCYAGKYKGILIIEVTRLSRGSQGDAQIIMDCLKYSNNNSGVLVLTPTKTYDVAHSHEDEEYMEFELFMSRREYKMIIKRMQRGKHQAIVEGNYMSTYRPYGYEIVVTSSSRTLEFNPSEALIVEKIFRWKVEENMSPGAIARKLTRQGVPTYTGKPEWSAATIKTILQNPTYYGKVKWNDRMTVKSMKDGQLVSSRPRSNHTEHYIEYDGKHTGIVTEEMFKAAQKGFTSDKTKSFLEVTNILSTILVCKHCGYAMTYNSYKSKAQPRILHKPSQICKVKSAIYSDVIDAFIHGLKMYLENFEMLIDNQPLVNEDDVLQEIQKLQKEKAKVQRILDKLFDDYEDELYTPNEFVQRKAKHNARLEAIEKEIRELESTIPERTEYEEKIMYLYEALEMLKDDEIPAKIKNDYLKQFVQKVEFSRENNEEFILDITLY